MQNPEKESISIKLRGGRRPGAGRPLGSPNVITRPVKELAAEQGEASIAKLVHLREHAESEQVRFAACKELLDRAYGRARQEIDVNADRSVRVIIQREPGPVLNVPPVLSGQSVEEVETVDTL